MGIGFTIDTPLQVARYGLTSTISLVDDRLIEEFRCDICTKRGLPYSVTEGTDLRARRITAYLNLVHELVAADFAVLQRSSFDDPKGISRHLRLLPTESPLRALYLKWQSLTDGPERAAIEAELRAGIRPGSIDVNIMTKLDRSKDNHGVDRPAGESDAVAALRGFASSNLAGAVVLSAGFNPKVNAALGGFDDFFPINGLPPKKRVILKVGDFRSAQVQGKMLSRRGIWPTEYRIESGLNCGGHAFPTDGQLMAPILEEFRLQREGMRQDQFPAYAAALEKRGIKPPTEAPPFRVTVQGGIGTAAEDRFLRERFGVDGTGWGTPFLLVEEVSRVTPTTRKALAAASTSEDVRWTWGSPLGVPFWSLRTSASEQDHRRRIALGKPGRACTNGHLALESLNGIPACPASMGFQQRKLKEISTDQEAHREKVAGRLMAPTCICRDLGGDARLLMGTDAAALPSICPGPSILSFDRELGLDELVDHIYGRGNVGSSAPRANHLVTEAELYLKFLVDEIDHHGSPLGRRTTKWFAEYRSALLSSLEFTRGLAVDIAPPLRDAFVAGLDSVAERLRALQLPESVAS